MKKKSVLSAHIAVSDDESVGAARKQDSADAESSDSSEEGGELPQKRSNGGLVNGGASKWNWKESPDRITDVHAGHSEHYQRNYANGQYGSFRRRHNDLGSSGHRHHQHQHHHHKTSRSHRASASHGGHQHWSQQKRRGSGSDSSSHERPFRRFSPPPAYNRPDIGPADDTQPAKTFYLSIDIETSGPSMVHHFMPCFGAAFIDVEECKVLEQRLFWIAQPECTAWDPETVRSFWNTAENQTWYHEVLDRQENSILPTMRETMCEFVDWVQNHLYAKYAEPHRSHNNVVQLISDNPSYDLGWLSYYLTLGTDGRVPHVQYLLNNRFNGRPIDTRSFCDGVRHKLHGPSFTRSDKYRQPKTVTQAMRVSQWKKRLLSEMGVCYDHNPKHDAVVIGINAAVVACAIADQLRTSPTSTPCLAKYDGPTATLDASRSSVNSGSSTSSSPTDSLPSPQTSSLWSDASPRPPPEKRFFPKPLNPSSATYVHQQHFLTQTYAHDALRQQQQQQQHQQQQQQSQIRQHFGANAHNNAPSWLSSTQQVPVPIGQIVSKSGVSAAAGALTTQ